MQRSSGRKGQVEPFAALAAVVALGAAFALYAGAYGSLSPAADPSDAALTEWTRVEYALRTDGVLSPQGFSELPAPPTGHHRYVWLHVANSTWTRGPSPPARATTHTEFVPVRVAPGTVRPGRLRVVVWTR